MLRERRWRRWWWWSSWWWRRAIAVKRVSTVVEPVAVCTTTGRRICLSPPQTPHFYAPSLLRQAASTTPSLTSTTNGNDFFLCGSLDVGNIKLLTGSRRVSLASHSYTISRLVLRRRLCLALALQKQISPAMWVMLEVRDVCICVFGSLYVCVRTCLRQRARSSCVSSIYSIYIARNTRARFHATVGSANANITRISSINEWRWYVHISNTWRLRGIYYEENSASFLSYQSINNSSIYEVYTCCKLHWTKTK